MHCFPSYLCLCSLRHLFHTSLHFFQYKVNILSFLQQIASRVESTLRETHSRYVILLSLHHSPFNLCLASSCHILFFTHPNGTVWCVCLFICFHFILLCIHSSLHFSRMELRLLHFCILPVYLCLSVAGNEYLIFSLSPVSDGLWE